MWSLAWFFSWNTSQLIWRSVCMPYSKSSAFSDWFTYFWSRSYYATKSWPFLRSSPQSTINVKWIGFKWRFHLFPQNIIISLKLPLKCKKLIQYEFSRPNLDTDEIIFRFLVAANDQCEWIWEIYKYIALGGFVACTVAFSAVSLIICYTLNGHFDARFVYHPNRLL